MEFKIELKDIEQLSIEKGRIITNKNGKKIEYIISNDIITEVNPYDENRIAEEKINKLLGGDKGVKKINTIIQMTKNKLVNSKYHYDYKLNANKENVESPTPKTDVDKVKGIISLEKVGVLDDIAAKNREEIARKLSEISVGEYDNDITTCDNSIDKLKKELFKTIQTEDIQNENVKEKILEKIEEYKKYFDTKNELTLKDW